MDFCRNVSVSGDQVHAISPLDDLFSSQNTEVDVSLEWLSVFVEDCLSSSGNCLLPPPITNTTQKTIQEHIKPKENQTPSSSMDKLFAIPGKARRSKRRRVFKNTLNTTKKSRLSSWSNSHNQTFYFPSSDPPMLHQAYWLADSELIMPKKEEEKGKMNSSSSSITSKDEEISSECNDGEVSIVGNNNSRRCSHCLSQRTPQWRAGPMGPKTLCNACGVRYKSGRLLPEYRPAKSPTFVTYLHSNSHKKVMEMRMASP
ncbi:GATA transcription factor 5-like [Mercurialis annua]|uniref:GATA transcription factor 5-like n=1 Tax=Mercurialis annua TaxID=3986 RepID=UPI00215F71C6|nr:GATA transcription factor 5-like [Mercurialis annua]XP_055961592.1 GATA transcription factor 5-like [Mercurialis annua]XP_055961593.1 GATA transcription factor 5-like [Mercurialis annua]